MKLPRAGERGATGARGVDGTLTAGAATGTTKAVVGVAGFTVAIAHELGQLCDPRALRLLTPNGRAEEGQIALKHPNEESSLLAPEMTLRFKIIDPKEKQFINQPGDGG